MIVLTTKFCVFFLLITAIFSKQEQQSAYGDEVITTDSIFITSPLPPDTTSDVTAASNDQMQQNDEQLNANNNNDVAVISSSQAMSTHKHLLIPTNSAIAELLAHKFAAPIAYLTNKFDKVADFFTLTNHPNFGGVQLLSPQYLWERLHEKGHHFLTGAHGSIYGLTHGGAGSAADYPFAYRRAKQQSYGRSY